MQLKITCECGQCPSCRKAASNWRSNERKKLIKAGLPIPIELAKLMDSGTKKITDEAAEEIFRKFLDPEYYTRVRQSPASSSTSLSRMIRNSSLVYATVVGDKPKGRREGKKRTNQVLEGTQAA